MLSFNNKKIEELSSNELSVQLFTLANFYNDNKIKKDYISFIMNIAELLENDFSDMSFSLNSFVSYLNNKQFSFFEKKIVLISYKHYINKKYKNLSNIEYGKIYYYESIFNLISSYSLSLEYKNSLNEYDNLNNNILKEIEEQIEKMLKLKSIYKPSGVNKILDISINELNNCIKYNNYFSI